MTIAAEREFRLRWMDFDRYGRMQPAALLDMFQGLAIVHAEELGIGRAAMLERGVVWVVVRAKLQVLRDPLPDKIVTIRTWPHSLSRFSFTRDFSMRDENGEELVKASQEWVLMNFETRTFSSTKDVYNGPEDFDEARAFDKRLRKLRDFEAEGDPALIVVPRFADIDVNGHVNNAVYGNYIVNAVNPGPDGAIGSLQIDYRHEALPDEPLAVHVQQEEGLVKVKAINPRGEISFAADIEPRDVG